MTNFTCASNRENSRINVTYPSLSPNNGQLMAHLTSPVLPATVPLTRLF